MEARGFFCYNVIMNLPSKKQCNELLKKYHTPFSVIKHSAVVTKIAEYLADEFGLSDEERRVLLPSGQQAAFDNRVSWARTYWTSPSFVDIPKSLT